MKSNHNLRKNVCMCNLKGMESVVTENNSIGDFNRIGCKGAP